MQDMHGRYARRNIVARSNGECELDIRHLARRGHLRQTDDLAWRWPSGSATLLHFSANAVTLNYVFPLRDGSEVGVVRHVAIARTRCHFGGARPWFICPECGRKAAILLLSRVPACTRCLSPKPPRGLIAKIDRHFRRQRTIERSIANQFGEVEWTRPKGMHAAKFSRLTDEYFRIEDTVIGCCMRRTWVQ
jgi:hypothetical protein